MSNIDIEGTDMSLPDGRKITIVLFVELNKTNMQSAIFATLTSISQYGIFKNEVYDVYSKDHTLLAKYEVS